MLGRALILTLVALAAGLSSCQSTEEDTSQVASGTPTAEPTASAAPSATATPSASPTPASTPSSQWLTYSDPWGLLTFDYPANWYADGRQIYSSNPANFSGGPGLPPGLLKMEFGSYPDDGVSGCGTLSVDPSSGMLVPEAGSTQVELGGVPAWQIVRDKGHPAIEGNLTRIQAVTTIHGGYCFNVAGYFTQADPDIATFERIVSSFRFLTK